MKPIVQKVICGGVLIYNNKALIIQRAKDDDNFPGLWEIPSGKKEDFENAFDAVKREFKEETGIEVNVIKPVYVFNYKNEKEAEIRDATQICFLVEVTGEPKVKLSSEHDNFAWVSEIEIDKYNISEETKESIKSAFR